MRFLGQREDRIILLGVAASIHAGAHEVHAVTQIERVVLQQGIRVLGRADCAAEVVVADVAAEGVVDGLLQTEHHAAALVHAAVVVLVHRAVAGVCRVVLDQPERLAGAYPAGEERRALEEVREMAKVFGDTVCKELDLQRPRSDLQRAEER